MPIIAPNTPDVSLLDVFDPATNEILHAYAAFVGQSVMFVLTHVVQDVLANDPDFVAWRASHPGSFLPPRRRRRARSASSGPTKRSGRTAVLSETSRD
jgi:hypothetical protein